MILKFILKRPSFIFSLLILYVIFEIYLTHENEKILEKEKKLKKKRKCFPCLKYSKMEGLLKKIPPFILQYYYKRDPISISLKNNFSYCRERKLNYDVDKILNSLLEKKIKIYFAIMFHNNEEIFPFWFSEFQKLMEKIKILHPFIAILESHSTDLSSPYVLLLSQYLQEIGVEHRIDSLNDFIP